VTARFCVGKVSKILLLISLLVGFVISPTIGVSLLISKEFTISDIVGPVKDSLSLKSNFALET
jgi:hypothetical protein